MELTPIDIRNQEFKRRTFGGVDSEEVAVFLQQVASEYENKIRQAQDLNEKLSASKAQVEHYKSLEQVLQNTALTLQRTLEEKTAQANREAEIIIAEAKAKAWQETEVIRREAESLRSEIEALRTQRTSFFVRMRHLVRSQSDLLEALESDEA